MGHPTEHAHLAAAAMTTGRLAKFFWPGLVGAAVAVGAPWIGPVAIPFALLGLLAHEHAYVQGRVRPARLVQRTPMTEDIDEIAQRVSAARAATEARGETFYPGASRVHLAAFPPIERWDDWVELSSRASPAWPRNATSCWSRPPASTASRRAGCWPTSTATPGR